MLSTDVGDSNYMQLHDVLAFVSTYGERLTDIIYKAEGRINNQRKKPWFL